MSKRALGEITYLSVVGGLLGLLLLKRFLAATAAVKKQFLIFTTLMLLFAVFGVLGDSIREQACVARGWLCLSVGILEDGSEILVTIMIIDQIRQLLAGQVERTNEGPSSGFYPSPALPLQPEVRQPPPGSASASPLPQ
ncbi:MAG: hypothetical protein ACR2OL_01125 [Anderseniella sp.]